MIRTRTDDMQSRPSFPLTPNCNFVVESILYIDAIVANAKTCDDFEIWHQFHKGRIDLGESWHGNATNILKPVGEFVWPLCFMLQNNQVKFFAGPIYNPRRDRFNQQNARFTYAFLLYHLRSPCHCPASFKASATSFGM